MATFEVDEDLVQAVWKLANPRPFENLSFSAALRRALGIKSPMAQQSKSSAPPDLDALLAESIAFQNSKSKKLPSPSVGDWVSQVPELRGKPALRTWQAICSHFGIDTGGDSARRKLRAWARLNRPKWPPVPVIDGET